MEIYDFNGSFYAKGHYKGSEFAQAVYTQYGKQIPPNEVRRTYWRIGKAASKGVFSFSGKQTSTFYEADGPGYGSFAVTVWKP